MISFEDFTKKIKLYIPIDFSFKCLDCGDCCRHESGYIFLLESEIKKIAKYLNIFLPDFKDNFTIKFAEKVYSLREKENYDCIFWEKENRNGKGGCSIYKLRPLQCINFPFWITTFSSRENFIDQMKRCKGIMSKEGKKYSTKDVYKLVYNDFSKRIEHYLSFISDDVKKVILND